MNRINKEHIISEINKKIPILKDRFHIDKIYLFGSYAKNKQHENSDIDILVEYEKEYKLNFSNHLNLQVHLYNIFKKDIGLCEKERIPKEYNKYIFNENLIEIKK